MLNHRLENSDLWIVVRGQGLYVPASSAGFKQSRARARWFTEFLYAIRVYPLRILVGKISEIIGPCLENCLMPIQLTENQSSEKSQEG
jgi:hypothetical protein